MTYYTIQHENQWIPATIAATGNSRIISVDSLLLSRLLTDGDLEETLGRFHDIETLDRELRKW